MKRQIKTMMKGRRGTIQSSKDEEIRRLRFFVDEGGGRETNEVEHFRRRFDGRRAEEGEGETKSGWDEDFCPFNDDFVFDVLGCWGEEDDG